jgi:hypothetical protein
VLNHFRLRIVFVALVVFVFSFLFLFFSLFLLFRDGAGHLAKTLRKHIAGTQRIRRVFFGVPIFFFFFFFFLTFPKMGGRSCWHECHVCCKCLWFLLVAVIVFGAAAMLVLGGLCQPTSPPNYCSSLATSQWLAILIAGPRKNVFWLL